MPFEWFYGRCPCCGRVVPDSRSDDLGECELCQKPRVLIDGPPEDWDVFIQEESKSGNLKAPRSQWVVSFENRSKEELCPHELKWFMYNKAEKIGGRV